MSEENEITGDVQFVEQQGRSGLHRAMIAIHALNESIVLWQEKCELLGRANRHLMRLNSERSQRIDTLSEQIDELQASVKRLGTKLQEVDEGDKIADNSLAAKDHEIKQLRAQIGEWESRYEAAVTRNGDHSHASAANQVIALRTILERVGGVAWSLLEPNRNKKGDYAGGVAAACGQILQHIPWPYNPTKDRPEGATDDGSQEATQEATAARQPRQATGA